MNVFSAIDIKKQYSNHLALDGVSIDVPEKSIFGLLGPNGAGKTSLIRIINQITAPDEGRLIFNGVPMKQDDVKRIGYLPEERGLYRKMKVGEQAMYLAQLKGLSRREASERLKVWFERFDIAGWWNRKVEELSKGMQQKIQFIVTVVHEPELLIFDEPFSGFDPINVNILKDEILRLRNNGATVIFSTHNMESVEELCDHIALIDNSKKILDGKVKDVKKTYKSNTFEVKYEVGNGSVSQLLNPDFTILETKTEEDQKIIKIGIKGNSNSNDLIKELLKQVDIISYNEILPTMNEIFISKVQEGGHA